METNFTLAALQAGQSAIITALNVQHELYLRLVAMGIRVGKRVEVLRSAAFSGPLHIRIGTTDIALRRCEGESIQLLLDSVAVCEAPLKIQNFKLSKA